LSLREPEVGMQELYWGCGQIAQLGVVSQSLGHSLNRRPPALLQVS
jgi:hypothetical protein